MKVKNFQNQIRALHKSGKLDDAVSHALMAAFTQLRHDLFIKNRQGAIKHFDTLCKILLDIIER